MNELEWLRRLLLELEKELPRIRKLRRYARNQPDLPEMGDKLRASWERFQTEATTNWAGLIVEPMVERVVPNAITVENDEEAEARVRQLWRDNRLDALFPDVMQDMFACHVGYFMVTLGPDGLAQITAEDPEQVVTIQDPARPWRSVAALKAWRDSLAGRDYAYVWHDGYRVTWSRDTKNDGQAWSGLDIPVIQRTPPTSWEFVDGSQIVEDVPFRRFDNRNGLGEFEVHIPLIDRLNRSILQRLVIASMQAYRQRALRQRSEDDPQAKGLPEHDEQGNKIDYAAVFEPAPGALWELPPGMDIWESTQADLTQIIASEKEDIKQLSAVTQTPLSVFMPDAINQAAGSAVLAFSGQVSKAKDRIKRVRPNLEGLLVQALRIEGYDLAGTLKCEFEPADTITMVEKYDAASKAKGIGESTESIQRNILGYSQPQIDRDREARATEALSLAMQTRMTGASNGTDTN